VISVAVHLSVYLSVCEHILKNTRPNFTNFFVLVACGRGSVLLWRRFNKLFTSGFVDSIVFFSNGHYGGVTYRSSTAAVSCTD